MARILAIHPQNPQARKIGEAISALQNDELIAYPTDSSYALGAQLGNKDGLERIRAIRHLDDKHHFTLMCKDFSQLGQFVHVDNTVFRAVKAATPGPYTFILPATREVPRRLLHPKKKTVGVRIPEHIVVQAMLAELGEPILSTTLMLPDELEPLRTADEVNDALGAQIDLVIESGEVVPEPTTVVDLSDGGVADVVRVGVGDPSPFQA